MYAKAQEGVYTMGQHGKRYATYWLTKAGQIAGQLTYYNRDKAEDGAARFGKYYRTVVRDLGTGEVMAEPVAATIMEVA